MNYFEEDICERIELAIGRLSDIEEEDLNLQGCVHLDELKDYFKKVSDFILYVYDVYNIINTSNQLSLEYLKRINNELYKDILPGNYEKSFANPDYAVDKLGEDYGKLLSFLYVEVRSIIAYIYEGKMLNFITTVELFIEIYSMFCDEEAPKSKYIKEAIYYHMYD
ncbi:MAG: leucyl aminopeptidase, partial [Lachnospiraceae bacterium]|nr:leucyl aminopeptidase [Lachnospiraceae bacterium]